MTATSLPAAEQVARLLVLIPYLQANNGVKLADLVAEFGFPADVIRKDLDVITLVGLPGGYPGDLIDIDTELVDEEGIVYIDMNAVTALKRPHTFTPDEAMGLIAALQAIREVAHPSSRAAVDSLSAKLRALVPLEPPVVTVEGGLPEVRQALLAAIRQAGRVELTYEGQARGQTSHPEVDPVRLFTADGAAYLRAWSVSRGGWRNYRLDRIAEARPTGAMAEAHGPEPEPGSWLEAFTGGPEVTLRLQPPARWVAEHYPAVGVAEAGSGRLDVTLPVSDPNWLRWLLLRLGPDVEVLDAPAAVADAARCAQAALDAYAAAGLA
jgi:proteasome accessory factor C